MESWQLLISFDQRATVGSVVVESYEQVAVKANLLLFQGHFMFYFISITKTTSVTNSQKITHNLKITVFHSFYYLLPIKGFF